MKKLGGLLLLVGVWLALCLSGTAAAMSGSIEECVISGSDQVIVRASFDGRMNGSADGICYLAALETWEETVTDSKIAGQCSAATSMTFFLPLNKGTEESLLYKKFVLCLKRSSGKYVKISNAAYLTNPEALANYHYKFPTAISKKGLQVNLDMLDDAEDLGVKHAAINLVLNPLLAYSSEENESTSYSYRFEGETYWFTKAGVAAIDQQVSALTRKGMVVTAILLLQNDGRGKDLLPAKTSENAYFYGINASKKGAKKLAALMSFLGERYMNSRKSHGRISNWIVGNEVENYGQYNYMGELSLSEYAKAYTRSFRIIYTALKSVYSNVRVYTSLSNCWNVTQPWGGSFKAKKMLDAFGAQIEKEGHIRWHLAYHPYPQPLTSPVFWDDLAENNEATRYVTMKNIGFLTDYVAEHFGNDIRVILSEQGFTSGNTKKSEQLQAAAYAYAYYIAEFNDRIDAFILHRHVDHSTEMDQGLDLGLWHTSKGKLEWASKKKEIYNVFKFIDTKNSRSVTKFALKLIGEKSWSRLIKGFRWSNFTSMPSYSKSSLLLTSKTKSSRKISNVWQNAYSGSATKRGSGVVLTVNSSANRNLYRGVGKTFKKPISFARRNLLMCRLQVTGSRSAKVHVRIRAFSGNQIFEAARVLRSGKEYTLYANLSKWSYKKKVTKIQVLVKPYGSKGWENGGKIVIKSLKQAKTAAKT